MKKALAIILSVVTLFAFSAVAFAAVEYDQVFDAGVLGSETYRIPALYTLNDGSVIAAADIRYDHGSDSPNNIDTAIAISPNGYTNWEYKIVNYFDDFADGETDAYSASFIDSAIVQNSAGKIFLMTDVWTSNGGYLNANKGTGFKEINGAQRLLLTTGDNSDALRTFQNYVGDFNEDGFAAVYKVSDSTQTVYSVDRDYNLYKNGEALMMKQYGSDKEVQQKVFYNDAELCCYNTCYLWLITSDDNGKTWSKGELISGQVKSNDESFLGICPGKGFVTTLEDGTERIIFVVYDNNVGGIAWNVFENVSTIYSDDGGKTWNRGAETTSKVVVGKTSESQIVELNNGVLRLYARNGYDYVAYADSKDKGVTWSTFTADLELKANGNCMVSFINTSKTIDGKKVILGSYPSNQASRADGVIRTGVVNDDNTVTWIQTYHVNQSFFAYSCLTELSDGRFGFLFEDEASHIRYMILEMDENGVLTEVNGENFEYERKPYTLWDKIVIFFKALLIEIQKFFGMV